MNEQPQVYRCADFSCPMHSHIYNPAAHSLREINSGALVIIHLREAA